MTEPRAYRQPRFQAPPGATELILVRHGESQAAVDGQPFELVDGQGDPALAPNGREQARTAGIMSAMSCLDNRVTIIR